MFRRVYCKDCGKILSENAYFYSYSRCLSCAQKIKVKGNKHPNYIDGRSLRSNKCLSCKRKINYRSKRCRKCQDKYRCKIISGIKNPNWKHGLSNLPYPSCFNEKLKTRIKVRDSFKCQRCFKIKYLSVHHIDYNKNNCKPNNLITLCRRCNSLANGDRDYWFAYYTYIIKE